MFTKKEILITVGTIAFFSALIFFLPQLEGKIVNRKTFEYEEEEQKIRTVDKYLCTFSSKSNLMSNVIEATFYMSGTNVTRIYTKESTTYKKKDAYLSATKVLEKNIETEDYAVKSTLDDINYTIITVKGINIKQNTKTDYPIIQQDLVNYLEKNNYTCTIRYKTS